MTHCAACGASQPCGNRFCVFGYSSPSVAREAAGLHQLAPAPAPPRVSGKVLGFRAWELHGYTLCSVAAPGGWGIGVNTAMCKMGAMGIGYMPTAVPGHEAPDRGCICGLYACHRPQALSLGHNAFPPHAAFGAILAWGRIEVHADGFRAQYAEPIILAYDRKQPYDDVIAVRTTAEEFNLPCVEISELEARAREFGEPIAPALRPAPSIRPVPLPGSGVVYLPPGAFQMSGGAIVPLSNLGTVTPPAPKPSRARLVAAASYGVGALVQLTFAVLFASIFNAVLAGVFAVLCALTVRSYLRAL